MGAEHHLAEPLGGGSGMNADRITLPLTPNVRHWEGLVADPTVTLVDGRAELNWQDDAPDVALIAREVLVELLAKAYPA